MSHQFSFLQLFAGYISLQCNFLSISRQNKQLKSLRAELEAQLCQHFEIIFQTDMRKVETQICQRLRFFRQMWLCPNTSLYFDVRDQLCHLPIGRLKNFKNQYIQWFKKLLLQLLSYRVESDIFDAHVAILLYKH